jgi:hypothetical protein
MCDLPNLTSLLHFCRTTPLSKEREGGLGNVTAAPCRTCAEPRCGKCGNLAKPVAGAEAPAVPAVGWGCLDWQGAGRLAATRQAGRVS